jgi:hypothetical protein
MVYSDTSTKLGLIQDCEDLTGLGDTKISGTAAMLARFTRWINEGYLKFTQIAITCDGRWQWDDSNQTDQPVATGDLVEDQRDYSVIKGLPSASQDWLEIDRIEIKDSNGLWTSPTPIDKVDYPALEELYKTSATPEKFDFEGVSIKLYPATSYNSTKGFKAYFKRAPLLFASTDTTKKPGFPSIFHSYLSRYASLQYCIANDMGRANNLSALLDRQEIEIRKYFGKRSKYEKPVLKRAYQSFK